MRLDVKRKLLARSDRVKGVDCHPTEPWILTTLYSGTAQIWSFETGQLIKSFDVSEVPIRAGRFVARKNWIVCGSDDFQLRVYNYNTNEKVAAFEAHPDYIRAIVVHPTQPWVFTASDDMTIRRWDWSDGWKMAQEFVGHQHYVMSLAINPKDTNTFASACLDRTVKIWSVSSGQPRSTIDAHPTKGCNYVDYFQSAERPYIVTASDDRTLRIYDYTSKSCIAVLEGHTANVSFGIWHSTLPILVSGAEDGSVRIWNANTYKLEQTLSYGLERAWCASYQQGSQNLAIGFDDGAVLLSVGREEPAVSMDSSGKMIWARHNEILSAVVKGGDTTLKDGSPVNLATKDLGNCEVYPQTLTHSPNGRFVAVCGDGEYIIYTALAWRNKAFGSALDFAWGSKDNSNDYAVRESALTVRVFANFKEKAPLNIQHQAEGLSGGVLLGVYGSGCISFHTWTGELVRRIEVEPRNVYWSESGELVTLVCEDTFYVLRFSREAYEEALAAGNVDEDGVEAAFEVVTDVAETAITGSWVGDTFFYSNSMNRLNYLVGDKTYTIQTFDQTMYVLGFLPKEGRIYICNKDIAVQSFALSLSVVEYQTLILRGELDAAEELLKDVPQDQRGKLARFLEGQDHKELALEIATDPDHRFDLALSLGSLPVALEIARSTDVEHRWKTVGDAALSGWDVALAEECFTRAKDLGSLLLLHTATANGEGLRALAQQAQEANLHNIAFSCLWQLADTDACIDLLTRTERAAEAVLFAQTYRPSRAPELVTAWRGGLDKLGRGKVSKIIGVPGEDDELFPEWDEYIRLEKEGGSAAELVDVNGGDEAADGAEEVEEPEAEAEVEA